ncbi:MAG TPA: flagellar hook-length control protein FliK [Chitinispirillaceae bacterium]|nr:flagellar hook-length control protein FliK [Chitinispirillaceae bacterium]
MIQKSTSQPVAVIGTPNVVQFKGCGRVVLTAQKDIFKLITENEQYTIVARGHTFADGDEVNFEFADGSVYLSKKVSPAEEQVIAQTLRDELLLQASPDTKVLIKTLKSLLLEIEAQPDRHNELLSAALLKQLTGRIKDLITAEQLEQLQQIITMLEQKNGDTDISEIGLRVRELINQLDAGVTQVKGSGSLLNVTPGLITFPDMIISEGIYQFQDKDSLLQFLGNPSELNRWEGYFNSIIESEGLLSMRIAATGDTTPGAFLVTSKALEDEMRSLICSIAPDILQKIPVETFLKFCNVNGGIDKEFISLLSGTVAGTANRFVNITGKGSSETLVQWLNLFNQNRDLDKLFISRQPSSKGTDLLRGILEVMEKCNVMPGLSLKEVGIVPGSGKDALTLIENTLQRMGITTESSFAHGVMPAGSVKAELYRLLGSQSGNGMEISAGTNKNITSIVNNPSDVIQNIRSFQNMLRQDAVLLRNAVQPQEQALSSIVSRAADCAEMIVQGSGDPQTVQLLSTLPVELQKRLSILLTALETVIQPEDASNGVVVQKLNDISGVLDVVKKISELLPGLSAVGEKIGEIKVAILSYLTSTRESQQTDDVSGIQSSKTFMVKEDAEFLTDEMARSTVAGTVDTTVKTPQKMIEQLINRIESIQLLARQVSVADGTSQILELPVKIGNEWTDVTLQFVKKRTGKKGDNSQKHFTVQLDTSPSRLGQIHAVLDYEKGKNLSITIEFEHREVTSWFMRNQEQIRKSLQENQIHFINLHFKTSADTDAVKNGSTSVKQNTGFDIRI